ncbi:MAG: alpha-1,3-galactosidase-related protein [Roseibacillus sp.]
MKCLLPTALFSLFHSLSAEIISVADHGIVPGKDATFAVNRLIESLDGDSEATIQFPKGRYEFFPENALETHRAVSNHDNSLKRLAFPLFNLKNVTIDGNGSEFIFHGRISPIAIDGSENITLKNFSIDWSRSFHDEYEVIARDLEKKTVRLKVDPAKYPFAIKHGTLFSKKYDWEDRMGSNMTFDPKTRSPIYDTKRYNVNFTRPHHASPAGKGLIDLQAHFSKEPPPVGSVLISYGTHPTSRLCPAMHLANSKDILIEGVTIYEAGGMGVIAERTENVRLQKVTVTSNSERLVSTRADATHFIGCKGLIHLEDCLFEHMLDDATNVHGAYVKVMETLEDNQLICEISHFQQWGLVFAGPGDEVALLSRETILPFHKTTVTAVKPINERRFLITLADIPDNLPDVPLSVENLTWNPDFVMRNNIVRENRARSVLVTTKGKVLIEGNTFASQMHGILIEGDNNVWYESGAVQDITIRDNDFINIGFEATDRYPLYVAPLLNETQRFGEGHYHRNIKFTGNRVKSFSGHFVHALSVSNLVIEDNVMEFSRDYPATNSHPAINLIYCDQVSTKNNTFKGFERVLRHTVSNQSTAIKFENNPGLEPTLVPAEAKN